MKMTKIKYYLLALFLVSIWSANLQAQTVKGDSLGYYLKIALENNPSIQAQKFKYEAFLEKIPQAGAYQDPELTIEAYTMPMDIIGGKSLGNASIMQMFPWFGTKKAARNEANHMANMQHQEYLESINTLTLQVSTQWYAIQKLHEQLHNNEENKALLKQVEQLAIRKFSAPSSSASPSGSSSSTTVTSSPTNRATPTNSSAGMGGMAMGNAAQTNASQTSTNMGSGASMASMTSGSASGLSEALRIQLEIIELENNIENLKALIHTEKAKFNALLNRDENEPVHTGSKIHKIDFQLIETDAFQEISQNNPMLGMLKEEALAYKAKGEMDRKMSYPMIGLGVQYMAVGKTNNPMFAMEGMNGKDMFMPMLTVSLPIFRKKYDAQQRESKLWWKSSEANYQNTYNTLKSEYFAYKNQLEDAERMISLYEKQSELAQTTYTLIIKEFVTGQSDLTNVIQVQRQLLDYQLKKAEATANYNSMVVSIQKVLSNKINTDYSKK